MRRRGASAGSRQGGFSLVELVVVLGVIGLILAFVVPKVDHLTPKYALRAAAREVGGTIDLARGTAAAKGLAMGIVYRLDLNTYQLYGPPSPDDGLVAEPGRLVPLGSPRTMPRGVKLRGVYAHEKGRSIQERGECGVVFDPLAIDGSHIVYLENEEGKRISVKFNALLGTCDYVDGTAEFEAPPE